MARVSNKYATVLRSALNSRKLAAISMEAEWLFLRLIVAVDCAGRFHGDAFSVACKVCTDRMKAGAVQAPQVEGWLAEMEAVGLIVRYVVDGEELLRVVNFYRPPNNKITPDFSPDPNEGTKVPGLGTKVPEEGKGVPLLKKAGPSQHNTTEHNREVEDARAREVLDIDEADPPKPKAKSEPPRGFADFDPPPWIPREYLDAHVKVAEEVCSTGARIGKVHHATKLRAMRLACIQFAGEPPKGWDRPGSSLWKSQLSHKRVGREAGQWILDKLERFKPGKGGGVEAFMRVCAATGPDPDGWQPGEERIAS